jgi:hypothetical protein
LFQGFKIKAKDYPPYQIGTLFKDRTDENDLEALERAEKCFKHIESYQVKGHEDEDEGKDNDDTSHDTGADLALRDTFFEVFSGGFFWRGSPKKLLQMDLHSERRWEVDFFLCL